MRQAEYYVTYRFKVAGSEGSCAHSDICKSAQEGVCPEDSRTEYTDLFLCDSSGVWRTHKGDAYIGYDGEVYAACPEESHKAVEPGSGTAKLDMMSSERRGRRRCCWWGRLGGCDQ